MEVTGLDFVTLTALFSYVFLTTDVKGQSNLPCCTEGSFTSCCQHPLCDSYNQSVSCSDLNSTFFTMKEPNSNHRLCNLSFVTTPRQESIMTTSPGVQTTSPPTNFFICLERCPEKFYGDSSRVCQQCDISCRNCTGSGSELKQCACLYGHNGTHCCPPGTKATRKGNSTSCVPDMEPEDKSTFPVVPVAAGVGGGVALVITIVVVYCCCCRRRRRNGGNTADDGSARTKKRPISRMIMEKLGRSPRKSHVESFDVNDSQCSLYENVESAHHGTIAMHAQMQHDKVTRYITDPTSIQQTSASKKFQDRPVTGMYQNDAAIRLQALSEKEVIATLPFAPAPPGGTQSKSKKTKPVEAKPKPLTPKPKPVTPKPITAKLKPGKVQQTVTPDDDSDDRDDYLDMTGKEGVLPPEVQKPPENNGGSVNTAFVSENTYQNLQFHKNEQGQEPQEDYENFEFPVKGEEPTEIYENA